MPSLCFAPNCSSRVSKDVGYKRAPGNAELRERWTNNMGRPGSEMTKNAYLCAVHFDEDQWTIKGGTRKLKSDAIPTLFCRCQSTSTPTSRSPLTSVDVNADHNYFSTPKRSRVEVVAFADKENNPIQFTRHDDHSYMGSTPKRPRTVLGPTSGGRQHATPRGRPKQSPSEHLSTCPIRPAVVNQNEGLSALSEAETLAAEQLIQLSSSSFTSSDEPSVKSSFSSLGELSMTSSIEQATEETSDGSPRHQTSSVLVRSEDDSTPSLTANPGVGLNGNGTCTQESPVPSNVRPSVEEFTAESSYKKMCERLLLQNTRLRAENTQLKRRSERSAKVHVSLLLASSKRFGEDQLGALAKGHGKGVKWSDATVRTALKLHFACGRTGYEVVSKLQMPLPCIRTLQKRLEHIKFSPGLLHEIITVLGSKFSGLSGHRCEAKLCWDECSVEKGLVWDPSTKALIGNATIPAAKPKVNGELLERFNHDRQAVEAHRELVSKSALDNKAEKAMVFAFQFIFMDCKQVIAYEFTSSSVDADVVAETLLKIIRELHKANVKIRVLVSDMGNLGTWKSLGFQCGRRVLVNSIPHPCEPGNRLYISPDIVHVFKNFKEMLVNNKVIHLCPELCNEYGLPTTEVNVEDLITLVNYQNNLTWKLAPKLKMRNVVSTHFNKMKVSGTFHTVNRRTAAALLFLSTQPEGNDRMVTMAWLLNLVFMWFQLMTSRRRKLALSKQNPEAYADAVSNLLLTFRVFQGMRVGSDGVWKPVQTGVKMATKTALDLSATYLGLPEVDFVLMKFLTSDLAENTFSCVRINRPNPTCLHFKQRLKHITCSQFWREVPGSSYFFDNDLEDAVDLLNVGVVNCDPTLATHVEEDYDEADAADDPTIPYPVNSFDTTMKEIDKPAFYFTCGYVVRTAIRQTSKENRCDVCTQALLHQGDSIHPYGHFTEMANYKDNCLVQVSDDVFTTLIAMEERIMALLDELRSVKEDAHLYVTKRLGDVTYPPMPQCHALFKTVMERFVVMRIKLLSENPKKKDVLDPSEVDDVNSSVMSSKTMGSRALADRFEGSKRHKRQQPTGVASGSRN